MPPTLTPRPLAGSLDELFAGVSSREHLETRERRSGSRFERVRIDGAWYVCKYVELDQDFTMRVTGDVGCRAVRAFAAGLYDAAPDLIDHAVVGATLGVGRNGWGGALLMRDVSEELLAPGDEPLPDDVHDTLIHHVAGLCARTWGWHDEVGLLVYADRWRFFCPEAIDVERALGWPEPVPRIAADGWGRFSQRAPAEVASGVEAVRRDVGPLVAALQATPSCLVHGDWKASNLGQAPDGRTVLVDWAYVGEGPACHELGWYLALNRSKLPSGRSKEAVIDQFRAALQHHGVATEAWWDVQLPLALLGTLVQFGWEKALGDDAELGWWCDRAREGLRLL